MRIAFISTILRYPLGGADAMWTLAAEAAAARGDNLFLSLSPLTAGHARIAALRASGAVLHLRTPGPATLPLGQRVIRKLGLGPISHEADLIAALKTFRPDLVVFSQGGTYDLLLYPNLIAWLRAGGVKFRIIANWQAEHPSLSAADLASMRDTLSVADAIHFLSTHNLAITRRHLLSPLPNARVTQIPILWQPDDATPWPAAPCIRLAAVCRLDPVKGIDLLLHALAAATLPEWQLNIYGSGPQENYLRETVAYLGLAKRVCFRGHVASLREIWAENQLFVSPAINEGVPMTIPEAMLCGRPVLATCVGGTMEWIEHGRTGFLCPAATVPLLVTSLIEAFAARDYWEAMGRAAAAAAALRYKADDYRVIIA